MKIKNKKIVISLIIVIIVILLTYGIYTLIKYSKRDNVRFEKEYEILNKEFTEDGKKYPEVDISAKNVFKYSNYKEVLEIIDKKEDAVVYLGNASCLYCRTVVQVLYDVSKDTLIEEIYYIDTELSELHTEELFDVIKNQITINDKFNIPIVLFIVDGKVVSFKIGTFASQKTPYERLNKTQKQALNKIYLSGINDVIAGMQN